MDYVFPRGSVLKLPFFLFVYDCLTSQCNPIYGPADDATLDSSPLLLTKQPSTWSTILVFSVHHLVLIWDESVLEVLPIKSVSMFPGFFSLFRLNIYLISPSEIQLDFPLFHRATCITRHIRVF